MSGSIAEKLQRDFQEFLSLPSVQQIKTNVQTTKESTQESNIENIFGLIANLFKECNEWLGEFQNQPTFVVTDANKNKTMTMFACVPTNQHIPSELFFQQKAKKKLQQNPVIRDYFYRLASFSDCEYLLAPILTLLLQSKGIHATCHTTTEHCLSTFPLLRMVTGRNKDDTVQYKDVHMTAFIDQNTGERFSLCIVLNESNEQKTVVNLTELFAMGNTQIDIHTKPSNQTRLSSTLCQQTDPYFQLFLWSKKLQRNAATETDGQTFVNNLLAYIVKKTE